MTGLLLTCLLGLSPGVQLADSTEGRHFRLVDYDPYYNMTRDDLLGELNRLDRGKASLVTPVVLVSIGAGFFIGGAIAFAVLDSGGLVAASLCILGGGVFLIVGVIMLAIRLVARVHYNADVEAVQRRLDELERMPGGGPQLPPPPPPPPPPPGAGFFDPAPRVVLAVF